MYSFRLDVNHVSTMNVCCSVLQCVAVCCTHTHTRAPYIYINDVKCRLCEEYYKERNIPEPPDTVESVGHIQCYVIAQLSSSHE